MANSVPTLSASGWERGIKEKSDRLMSYFLVSQYSQSQINYGTVGSLPYLIKTYAETPDRLSTAIQDALTTIYGAYFDTVTVIVNVVDEVEGGAKQRIEMDVTVTENGLRYTVGRLLEVNNSIIGKVTERE